MLAAASLQDHLFDTAAVLYVKQGQENSGWVNPEGLLEIFKQVPGLDGRRAIADAAKAPAVRIFDEAQALADKWKSEGTPDVYVTGPSGETLRASWDDADGIIDSVAQVR